jgi:PAP2 superfamily
MRRYLHPAVAATVLTATLVAAPPAAGHSRVDGATSVLAWNLTAVETIVSVGAPAETPPVPPVPGPVAPLYLAYVHRAVYDAVQDAADQSASVPAAVAAAAHTVLEAYFPQTRQQTIIDAAWTNTVDRIPAGTAKTEGIAVGEDAAATLLRERQNDGLDDRPLRLPQYRPGVWTPAEATPPTPPVTAAAASWLGTVEPFVLRSPSQFRPDGPPDLTSSRWARAFDEVKVHGSSANPVEAETDVGRFWADPPAVQSQRALRLYAERQRLDAIGAARLLALTNTASADALIACADAKFHFNFWRPFSAIPRAADDGNPQTVPDPGWTPLVPTPNFPEYPSNHSCATTAIVTVIDGLNGESPFRLTISSYRGTPPVLAETQTFASAQQVIDDVANGRVWGGLHYRFSTTDGTEIGRAVAAKVLSEEG